jgi:hypothetical protein
MKNKCNYYDVQNKRIYTYHQVAGQPITHDIDVGVCWGTREKDECSCGGDVTKCDFYPEVREKLRRMCLSKMLLIILSMVLATIFLVNR